MAENDQNRAAGDVSDGSHFTYDEDDQLRNLADRAAVLCAAARALEAASPKTPADRPPRRSMPRRAPANSRSAKMRASAAAKIVNKLRHSRLPPCVATAAALCCDRCMMMQPS